MVATFPYTYTGTADPHWYEKEAAAIYSTGYLAGYPLRNIEASYIDANGFEQFYSYSLERVKKYDVFGRPAGVIDDSFKFTEDKPWPYKGTPAKTLAFLEDKITSMNDDLVYLIKVKNLAIAEHDAAVVQYNSSGFYEFFTPSDTGPQEVNLPDDAVSFITGFSVDGLLMDPLGFNKDVMGGPTFAASGYLDLWKWTDEVPARRQYYSLPFRNLDNSTYSTDGIIRGTISGFRSGQWPIRASKLVTFEFLRFRALWAIRAKKDLIASIAYWRDVQTEAIAYYDVAELTAPSIEVPAVVYTGPATSVLIVGLIEQKRVVSADVSGIAGVISSIDWEFVSNGVVVHTDINKTSIVLPELTVETSITVRVYVVEGADRVFESDTFFIDTNSTVYPEDTGHIELLNEPYTEGGIASVSLAGAINVPTTVDYVWYLGKDLISTTATATIPHSIPGELLGPGGQKLRCKVSYISIDGVPHRYSVETAAPIGAIAPPTAPPTPNFGTISFTRPVIKTAVVRADDSLRTLYPEEAATVQHVWTLNGIFFGLGTIFRIPVAATYMTLVLTENFTDYMGVRRKLVSPGVVVGSDTSTPPADLSGGSEPDPFADPNADTDPLDVMKNIDGVDKKNQAINPSGADDSDTLMSEDEKAELPPETSVGGSGGGSGGGGGREPRAPREPNLPSDPGDPGDPGDEGEEDPGESDGGGGGGGGESGGGGGGVPSGGGGGGKGGKSGPKKPRAPRQPRPPRAPGTNGPDDTGDPGDPGDPGFAGTNPPEGEAIIIGDIEAGGSVRGEGRDIVACTGTTRTEFEWDIDGVVTKGTNKDLYPDDEGKTIFVRMLFYNIDGVLLGWLSSPGYKIAAPGQATPRHSVKGRYYISVHVANVPWDGIYRWDMDDEYSDMAFYDIASGPMPPPDIHVLTSNVAITIQPS